MWWPLLLVLIGTPQIHSWRKCGRAMPQEHLIFMDESSLSEFQEPERLMLKSTIRRVSKVQTYLKR